MDETRRVLFKQTCWGSPVVWAVDNSEIVREGTINNSEQANDGSQNASISHISITMLVEQTSTSSRSEKTIPLFPNACSKFRRPIHVVYGTCTLPLESIDKFHTRKASANPKQAGLPEAETEQLRAPSVSKYRETQLHLLRSIEVLQQSAHSQYCKGTKLSGGRQTV